jgi:PadR family transcriptional regulator PadR
MVVDAGAQLRKGVVEYCVLGLLSRERMYGWQLSERLVASGLIASIGTLYPMLARLRSQGLVTALDEASASGPVRKYYRLTPLGEAQLESFRDQWVPFAATVHQLVGKDGNS